MRANTYPPEKEKEVPFTQDMTVRGGWEMRISLGQYPIFRLNINV